MINQETKLPYAKFDHSDTLIRQAQHRHVPTWQGAWLWCLRHNAEEAAQIIYDANNMSLECEYGDHDYCHSERCSCVHHRAFTWHAEGSQLKSLREVASEEAEMEDALV